MRVGTEQWAAIAGRQPRDRQTQRGGCGHSSRGSHIASRRSACSSPSARPPRALSAAAAGAARGRRCSWRSPSRRCSSLGEVWDSPQFRPVRDHVPLAIAGALAGLVLLALLARLFLRRPERVPAARGRGAAVPDPAERRAARQRTCCCRCTRSSRRACCAYAWERLRPDPQTPPSRRPASREMAPRDRRGGDVELALLIAIVLYGDTGARGRPTSRRRSRTSPSSTSRSRCCSGCSRRPNWTRRLAINCLVRCDGAGARLRRDRLRRVRHAPPVLEPEGDRVEPVRVLLPGQLAVLRPEHLRALPRGRDVAAGGGAALGAQRGACWPARPSLLGDPARGLVLTFSQSSLTALLVSLLVLAALRWPAKPVLIGARRAHRGRPRGRARVPERDEGGPGFRPLARRRRPAAARI